MCVFACAIKIYKSDWIAHWKGPANDVSFGGDSTLRAKLQTANKNNIKHISSSHSSGIILHVEIYESHFH